MEMSQEEMFVFKKWKYEMKYAMGSDEEDITPEDKERFRKYYRKHVQKKLCCIKRIKNDINIEKIKELYIKFSVYDNCSLTFGTHMMQKMIPLYLKDGRLRYYGNGYRTVYRNKVCNFESISLKELYARQEELKGNPMMIIDRKRLPFESLVNLKKYDNTYRFGEFNFCHCKRNKESFDSGVRSVSKNTSFMDPPMCTAFLRPYVMDQSSLKELNLKNTLSDLLLPYSSSI